MTETMSLKDSYDKYRKKELTDGIYILNFPLPSPGRQE